MVTVYRFEFDFKWKIKIHTVLGISFNTTQQIIYLKTVSCVLYLTCLLPYEAYSTLLHRKKQNYVMGNLQIHIENNFPLLILKA